MKVAIVKYNAGNVRSLTFALNRLGIEPVLTDDPDQLSAADKVIFPGQGEAGTAMRSLRENGLDKVLRELRQPFLGICLGMHLMCRFTEENDTACLGIIPEKVLRFPGRAVKVPHMGWNDIARLESRLFEDIKEGDYFYFVHSYYVPQCEFTIASCEYPDSFSAAIQKDNYHAIQPHPEKSAGAGIKLLENFLKLPS